MPRASPVEAIYLAYNSKVPQGPMTQEEIASWVEAKIGFPKGLTKRTLEALVLKRQTWAVQEGLYRPKHEYELPPILSAGFPTVKYQANPGVSPYVVLVLVALLTVGVLTSYMPLTVSALTVLFMAAVKDIWGTLLSQVKTGFDRIRSNRV